MPKSFCTILLQQKRKAGLNSWGFYQTVQIPEIQKSIDNSIPQNYHPKEKSIPLVLCKQQGQTAAWQSKVIYLCFSYYKNWTRWCKINQLKHLPEQVQEIHLVYWASGLVWGLPHAFCTVQEPNVLHFSQIRMAKQQIVSLASLDYQKQAFWQIPEMFPTQALLLGQQTFNSDKLDIYLKINTQEPWSKL